MKSSQKRLEALIEEARVQSEEHPSKDARFFASSVYEYLLSLKAQQERTAWRFTGIAGLKRYMSQRQYDAQTSETKKWYEPFKCANCITSEQGKFKELNK